MKTNIYLLSMLAFSLSMNAQNSKPSSDKSQTESTNSASSDNKRILTRLGGKSVPDNLDAEHPVSVKSANISGESERNDLLKLAEALAYQSRRLKNEAATKSGEQKAKLLNESALYEKNSLLKQIEASEIFGTISQVKFNSNKETIKKLLASVKLEAAKISRTKHLISSAERDMHLAKELREEAYTRTTLTAKLGSMSNAEEKEVLALGEQSQAIDLLWKKPGPGM